MRRTRFLHKAEWGGTLIFLNVHFICVPKERGEYTITNSKLQILSVPYACVSDFPCVCFFPLQGM